MTESQPEPKSVEPFVRLDHVQLAMPAHREDAARAFYAGILGMSEEVKPPELAARGGAWFRSGDVVLHLGIDGDFKAARKAHPALRCANYDQIVAALERAGIAIVRDELPFAGSRHCYIADPFGNRIELIE